MRERAGADKLPFLSIYGMEACAWTYFPEISDGELQPGHSDARVGQNMDALHECRLTGPEDNRLLQGGSRASMEPSLPDALCPVEKYPGRTHGHPFCIP